MLIVIGVTAFCILLVVAFSLRSAWVSRTRATHAKESIAKTKELAIAAASLHPRVDPNRCIGSGACIEACPEIDVLALVDNLAQLANPNACIGHGECLRACPVEAITLVMGSSERGVDLPHVGINYESNVPGLYIVGELGGMGLIYNAMNQALQCMNHVCQVHKKTIEGVYDVAIVGAGPAGLAATLAAHKAGLNYLTLDQDSFGGTVLQYPRNKIVMTRSIKLPLVGDFRVSSIHKEDLLQRWQDIVASTGIRISSGCRVDAVKKHDAIFEITCADGTCVKAQRVVLAVGRRGTPKKLGIKGEECSKVAYRLLEAESYRGTRCLVVGGGDSAVEAACALHDAAAQVHLVHRGTTFSRIKTQNQQRLDAAASDGLTVWLNAQVTEIADQVLVDVAGAPHSLDNDYVFIFAGGVLPVEFLKNTGVDLTTYRGEAYAPAN